MAIWAKYRATLFIIHQVHLSYQLPLILVDSNLASESHNPFVLPYGHVSEAIDDCIGLLLKASDLTKDTGLGVGVRIKVKLVKVLFITVFFVQIVYVHLACSVSVQVHVVDPVLELLSHFISVLVEGLLDYVLICLRDLVSEALSDALLHDFFVVASSDSKSISLVNRLVEEL